MQDRLPNKHESIMERSIRRGGRRNIFLGTSECFGLVDEISQEKVREHVFLLRWRYY